MWTGRSGGLDWSLLFSIAYGADMRQTNLRNIDLNLLPILDILLREKSVTLASNHIHLSQSATSAALRRLRETFDDPILVRDGNKMTLSPKARLIQEDLQEALHRLGETVSVMRHTDIAADSVDVGISIPEYVATIMTDALRQLIQTNAGIANINLTPFSRRHAIEQLGRGEIDIVIGAFGHLDSCFRRTRLFREKLVVGFKESHAGVSKQENANMALEEFTQFPHLVVTGGDVLEEAWISKELEARSIERKIGAVIPSLSLVNDILQNTDFICVGTERVFDMVPGGQRALSCMALPRELGLSDYYVELFWHERTTDHPLLKQIRNNLVEASRQL